MKERFTQIFLLLGSIGILSVRPSLVAEEAVRMTPSDLVKLDVEHVPEKVHVTDVTSSYSGYDLVLPVDIEAYILETIPSNWENTGKGTLSVSDKHSAAGHKSIRWDWKQGDTLRIKNLGMLTHSEITNQDGRGLGNGEAFCPSFSLAAFQESKAKEDMAFHFFYKRIHKEREHSDFEPAVIQLRQYANPVNFWFGLSGVAYNKAEQNFCNQEVVREMPNGVPEPEENELIIQAPTDVASGTIYLDRLFVAASRIGNLKSNREAASRGLKGPKSGIGMTTGITPEPAHFTDRIPETLTAEQQAYITELRNNYFNVNTGTQSESSTEYNNALNKAKELLAAWCTRQGDGSYQFKSDINYAADGCVMFKGDLYIYRKWTHHLPEGVTGKDHVSSRSGEIFNLFFAAPGNEYTKALFKAYVQWERTHIYDPVYVPAPGGKYGYSSANARKIISVIKGNPEFEEEFDYISRLPVSGDAKHYGIFHQKRDPYWSMEFPHSHIVFDNMLFEPDDRRLYAMLENYRDSLNWYYAISTPGKAGMVKPDYTFFHHSALTYWNITNLPWPAAPKYLGGPLDFDPSVHRMWVNHISRWHHLTAAQELAAGQVANWQKQTPNPPTPDYPLSGEEIPELTKREIAEAAGDRKIIGTTEFVNYVNQIDWDNVPAAKKHMAGLLGRGLSIYGQPVVEELQKRYPKTTKLKPQTNLHLSANYTGWTSYTHGATTAFVRGNSKTGSNFGEGGTRQYGMLMLYNRMVNTAMGVGHGGYSMLEIPGTTIPSLTEVEWNETAYGFSVPTDSGNPHHLPINRIAGSGAVTFNETEEEFGVAGNHSVIIDETGSEKWRELGVQDFVGKKSYHFFKDKIVALGSDYQAKTNRKMKTVLIQDLVDDSIWNRRDYRRWNTEQPTLNVNGKKYVDKVSLKFDLSRPNYFINPYGHAWIVPGGQDGQLEFDWKERSTTLVSRFDLKNGGFAERGEYSHATKGTGIIGRIEQDANAPSSHHYCVILNSDGKTPDELEGYVKQTAGNMGYQVLKQDNDAHVVRFDGNQETGEKALFSYVIFEPNSELNVPGVSSVNRRMNLISQKDKEGRLVVSIADPEINYDESNGIEHPEGHGYNKEDPRNIREVRVTFSTPVELVEITSGLPESNPDLNARVEDGNTLTFQTRDGVSDTFVLEMQK